MNKLIYIIIIISFSLYAESDIRTVTAEYERCGSVMERVERDIKRYEELINTLLERLNSLRYDNSNLYKEITSLENKLEYFRNRYERSRGQSDKINSDLKEVKGPTCPSCIESSVNLYCRNAETLQNELEDYISKASDLQGRLTFLNPEKKEKTPQEESSSNKLYENHRSIIDSMYRALSICNDSVAKIISLQIVKNISKADSVYKKEDTKSAFKFLNIAEILINKAKKRCSEIK